MSVPSRTLRSTAQDCVLAPNCLSLPRHRYLSRYCGCTRTEVHPDAGVGLQVCACRKSRTWDNVLTHTRLMPDRTYPDNGFVAVTRNTRRARRWSTARLRVLCLCLLAIVAGYKPSRVLGFPPYTLSFGFRIPLPPLRAQRHRLTLFSTWKPPHQSTRFWITSTSFSHLHVRLRKRLSLRGAGHLS